MTQAQWIGMMQQFEDIIRQADNEANAQEQTGLRARWESGRRLFKVRQRCGGLRLPNRMLQQFVAALTVPARELNHRMKFAEKYPTEDELSNAVTKFRTWRAITQKALTDTPREKKPVSPLHRIVTLLEKVNVETISACDLPLLERIRDLAGQLGQALAREAA